MERNKMPNVILLLTDDQGYGDLGCTGNPWLKTPNLDGFYKDSVRFTDFHVSPICTPTRGALMTGRYPVRNGAHTVGWGRQMLWEDETTIADVFSKNGYKTGVFGKWHLGETYPYRPHDRGFKTAVVHQSGFVGCAYDYWGNNYFDDTYFHNGKPEKYKGYCTDIWFEEASHFISEAKADGFPFFCYLATNAPHSPYLVDPMYTKPYAGNRNIPVPEFYGMIANIDENFGKLRKMLKDTGIEDNTIIIFMTDNGSAAGCEIDKDERITKGYNAGMRGKKCSYYEGGHRVPFFIRWPAHGLLGGRDIDELAAHIDLFPTLIELCGLEYREGVKKVDGISLAELFKMQNACLPKRNIYVQYTYNSKTRRPEKWNVTVMHDHWRLVKGNELYDIKIDPGQLHDVSANHLDMVSELRAAHESMWNEVSPGFESYCPVLIGNENEDPLYLHSFFIGGQEQIRAGLKRHSFWTVRIEKDGDYRFHLMRWPEELGLPVNAVLADMESRSVNAVSASMIIDEKLYERSILEGDDSISFIINLKCGETEMEAWFTDIEGENIGAYYMYIEKLNQN